MNQFCYNQIQEFSKDNIIDIPLQLYNYYLRLALTEIPKKRNPKEFVEKHDFAITRDRPDKVWEISGHKRDCDCEKCKNLIATTQSPPPKEIKLTKEEVLQILEKYEEFYKGTS